MSRPISGVFRACLLATALAAGLACPRLPAAPIEANAPLVHFALPTFTPEGYRSLLLHGDQVRILSADHIEVSQMQLTQFDGKPDNHVDTVFISSQATFFPSRQFAEGSQGVRIIRDDVEMSGIKWTYDNLKKKVVIDGSVRVIFRGQLDSLLQ